MRIRRLTLGSAVSPTELTTETGEILKRLARQICDIETRHGAVTKMRRSKLAPDANALQEIIDDLLFGAAGFSGDDVRGVRDRLDSLA